MKWLAVLDMDGTLLKRRTIDVLCENLYLTEKLREIDEQSEFMDDYEVNVRIANLFSGLKASDIEEIFATNKTVDGAREFVGFLKSKEFVTAIVTDSYTFLATKLATKLGVDAVKGNVLGIVDGIITGRIVAPLGGKDGEHDKGHTKATCKLEAMLDLCRKYSIEDSRTLAVGDTKSDSLMVEKAHIGVAFRPKDESLIKVATLVVHTDFFDLMNLLKAFLNRLGN
jgi:phosphoserine phosphatase